MSLGELAEFFQRLGATEALNLDGGGSTAMVVEHTVVNRPSDREGERANANAIVILGLNEGTTNEECRR
jgi:exopolysaccharide biosynthesis protein